MEDKAFRQLLDYLRLSWPGYRKVRKGVKKRIARHMEQCGCRTMEDYIRLLEQEQGLRMRCEQLMAVSISRFFRDRALWVTLAEDILPRMIVRHFDTLRVWCAGCACGEEVYSLKILWEGLKHRFDHLPVLEIMATDISPAYVARAKAGVYTRSSLKEVPEGVRSRYFRPQKVRDTFAVTPLLKKGILWKRQHLLSDFPEGSFHLILLRNNLLTYYVEEVKGPVFEKVIARLELAGYLIIGSHEKVPAPTPALKNLEGHPCIFQRILATGSYGDDMV